MVPSMDLIRAKVVEEGEHIRPWPSSREWGHGEVFQVVQSRWRQAIRETCTHSRGFKFHGSTSLFGRPRRECWLCHKQDPVQIAEWAAEDEAVSEANDDA